MVRFGWRCWYTLDVCLYNTPKCHVLMLKAGQIELEEGYEDLNQNDGLGLQ